MKYYTGAGDSGTSKLYGSDLARHKSQPIFFLLGTLDELNSWLGLCKLEASKSSIIYQELRREQESLFISQAHFAGAKTRVTDKLVQDTEASIERLAGLIKPSKGFVVPGGSALASKIDFARTLARKSERYAWSLSEAERDAYDKIIFTYLNRLSSLLYVLARYANEELKVKEEVPGYGQ